VLASLTFAVFICLRARTIALLASVMSASVLLVGVRLSLDGDIEVLTSLADSTDKDLITVWPLTLKLLLLVVLFEGVLGNFVVEEGHMGGGIGILAGGICAFNFGMLDASDAVVVVVDGCLQHCSHHLISVVPELKGK
jgi:hypothetical protein